MMFLNKESLNVTETICNLYVPVGCLEQDYVGYEIPVFIAKKFWFMLKGWNTLTVSLKICLSIVCLLQWKQ